MDERICPHCRQVNLAENRFCGQCGAPLSRFALVLRRPVSITVAGRPLPSVPLKRVGRAAAVGLAALLLDAGIAFLRRRVHQALSDPPRPAAGTALVPSSPARPPRRRDTLVAQRVTEGWKAGRLRHRTVEHVAWQREE